MPHGFSTFTSYLQKRTFQVRAGAAVEAAARQGTTLNAAVIEFLRWFGGLTDNLPERPERRSRG